MLGCQSLVTLVRLTACRVKNNLSQYEESSFVLFFLFDSGRTANNVTQTGAIRVASDHN